MGDKGKGKGKTKTNNVPMAGTGGFRPHGRRQLEHVQKRPA